MKEKTRKIFAFILYIFFIGMIMEIDLPLAFEIIYSIVLIFITLFGCTAYISEWIDEMLERNRGKLWKNILKELKKIAKEILMYIPIFLISKCITSFIMVGQPVNQTSIEQSFYELPIFNLIMIIIIGPIVEEFIFRFLPYKFIKNKTLYIIVSAVIFAAMHVVNDTNPFYYIWFYMIMSLYYGYCYHRTRDILVPIFVHSFNNLVVTLLFVLS